MVVRSIAKKIVRMVSTLTLLLFFLVPSEWWKLISYASTKNWDRKEWLPCWYVRSREGLIFKEYFKQCTQLVLYCLNPSVHAGDIHTCYSILWTRSRTTFGENLLTKLLLNRYWHRSLNPKKLIEIKFSHLTRNMTIQRILKLYKLPENTKVPGFRKMVYTDVTQAHKILKDVSFRAL